MTDLNFLSGIGPATLIKLARLNITSQIDLINHFPARYIDFSHITNILSAPLDQNITISGTIIKFNQIFTRSGKNIQKATLQDKTGTIELVWFNQPFLSKTFTLGSNHLFAGTISLYQNRKTMIAPIHGHLNTAKIIAIYPETSGLTSAWFRKIISQHFPLLIKNITENLPLSIVKKYQLLPRLTAYQNIHQPQSVALLEKSRTRLALDELISIQTHSYLQKKKWHQTISQYQLKSIDLTKSFIKSLPFTLTSAQIRVWQEIENDLTASTTVTNRLLVGDVGSGKTIIALLACLLTHLNGYQSIIVVPTQILAKQHFATFTKYLNLLKIHTSLLTSDHNLSPSQIKKTHIIIATHAALFKNPKYYQNVGLVVIDEQHKFGVKQRSFFHKLTHNPHLLTMTATPIPRTISLTLLGDLETSYLDELPSSRLTIKTFSVPPQKQLDCYHWINQQIKQTHCQVFIVCPFIEASESNTTVKAAKVEFEYLSKQIFPNLKLALIHGKTKTKDRHLIMKAFALNKINILVTTPIIEVGIDFPNATIMLIQSADRFGLAQLHQLRGRVGRGAAQSYCYLFSENASQPALNRLQFLEKHHNGLVIAEYDLKLRGPGDYYSFLQHGFPSLKLADLSDTHLINHCQNIIKDIVSTQPNFDLKNLLNNKIPTSSIKLN